MRFIWRFLHAGIECELRRGPPTAVPGALATSLHTADGAIYRHVRLLRPAGTARGSAGRCRLSA